MSEPKHTPPVEAEPSPLQIRNVDPQLKREINAYAKLNDMTLAQVITKAFKLLVDKKD